MITVFILVPSFDPTGPVKGACALANILTERFSVILVALKEPPQGQVLPTLSSAVQRHSLAGSGGWRQKLAAYKTLLQDAQAATGMRPVSISLCFSADVVNALCASSASTVTSIRSNLFKDYRMGFGVLGMPLALFHFLLLNRFLYVIAMTRSMAGQIARFISREPVVIGNFVDERSLEPYRATVPAGPFRFLFLGSLTVRKQPMLVIQALAKLVEQGLDANLDMVGKGPLLDELQREAVRLGLQNRVIFHGHLSDPYSLLAAADVMVLPSLSEGLSRASLESLYLGVPCVLRDVDGNSELVSEGANGSLFKRDADLVSSMRIAANLRHSVAERVSLLPEAFRQAHAERCFIELVERLESSC